MGSDNNHKLIKINNNILQTAFVWHSHNQRFLPCRHDEPLTYPAKNVSSCYWPALKTLDSFGETIHRPRMNRKALPVLRESA